MEIILKPHITEKIKGDKYVFEVDKKANKPEIKKAVEKEHKVDIIKINIINTRPKPRILRGIRGYKRGYKKAIITVKHGQKIETIEKTKSRPKPR